MHSEDYDQTGRMLRLIWVFAGRTVILLVLSQGGSFVIQYLENPKCSHDYIQIIETETLVIQRIFISKDSISHSVLFKFLFNDPDLKRLAPREYWA